jgi:hypothetical protein
MQRSETAPTSTTTTALLRGTAMRDTKDWIVQTYGPELYKRALAKLSAEERAVIDGTVLAGSLYPLAVWDRFLAAARAEVRQATGETEEAFDRRNVFEAGPRMARTAYSILLRVLSPTTILARVGGVLERLYDGARATTVENVDGRCVLRLVAAEPFRDNVRRHFPLAVEMLLTHARTRNTRVEITKNEVGPGREFTIEVTTTYSP